MQKLHDLQKLVIMGLQREGATYGAMQKNGICNRTR